MLTFTLGLLAAGPAFAQEEPKLPLHGWVRADLDTAPLGGQGWVGLAVPFSRTTALAIDAFGSRTAAGLDLGPTIEIGSLYLAPAAGFEYSYAGVPGVALQLQAAFEAPPLPLYLETWVRGTVRSPFGGADDVTERTLILVTLRQWLALGAEHDAVYAADPLASNRWGLRFNFGLGDHVVLGVFGGYEFEADARARVAVPPDWLAGRATLNVAW